MGSIFGLAWTLTGTVRLALTNHHCNECFDYENGASFW